MIRQNYWDGHCNEEETRNFPLTEDSLIMDIGAYRGTWTEDIVNKYHCNAEVLEPVKEFYQACVEKFKQNPKVKVNNFGLSDKYEVVILAKQGVNSSIYRGLDTGVDLPTDRVFGEAVPEKIITHDIYVFMANRTVDVMSMNCEAGEYILIDRLIKTGRINQVKNLLVQFHNFVPDAEKMRQELRSKLTKTHKEIFCYPFVWECWQRNDS